MLTDNACMADNLTPEQRHRTMSHIRSSGSRPEEIVRKYLFGRGLRYRKNVRTLPGCPDIVLPKYKAVVFVHGCFWHRHDCPRFRWPKSNEAYWRRKIAGNVERDRCNQQKLKALGWSVFVIWECELHQSVRNDHLEALFHAIVQQSTESS